MPAIEPTIHAVPVSVEDLDAVLHQGAVVHWRGPAHEVCDTPDGLTLFRDNGALSCPYEEDAHGAELFTRDVHLANVPLETEAHARFYFEALHLRGLLFHPEDDAADCIGHKLDAVKCSVIDESINLIHEAARREGFDVCGVALAVLNDDPAPEDAPAALAELQAERASLEQAGDYCAAIVWDDKNRDRVARLQDIIAESGPKEYRVVWSIEVEATSPREAAEKARQCQTRPGTTATVFDVSEHKPGAESVQIDLSEE